MARRPVHGLASLLVLLLCHGELLTLLPAAVLPADTVSCHVAAFLATTSFGLNTKDGWFLVGDLALV